jgi:hypothetical protein
VPPAVKSGEYDAGSANIIALDPSFRVVHTFTNVLRMPFVARHGIDPTVAQALRRALLAQDSLFVLTNIFPDLKGFREVSDQDYDALRKEMKEAEQFGDL